LWGFGHHARWRPAASSHLSLLKALDITLSAEQSAALDKLTTPTLNFPAELLPMVRMLHAGGTTINGEKSELLTLFGGPTKPGDHY
jgi:hypothetical protein